MATRHQESPSPFVNVGGSRSSDLAVTILTALILLVVLAIVATL